MGRFTLGYIVSVGIAATIFFLFIKWAGKAFPNLPVIAPVARAI